MTHQAQQLIHSKLTLAYLLTNLQYCVMDYIDWERLFPQLLLSILTLRNRQYCLLGYLDLGEGWKTLLAFWGRLPYSKLTLRNQRYYLLGYCFLERLIVMRIQWGKVTTLT